MMSSREGGYFYGVGLINKLTFFFLYTIKNLK
jgi:hypothetical protein